MQPNCNFYSVKRCRLKIKHRVKDFDHMSPGSRRLTLTCSKLTMETLKKCEICSKLTTKTPERVTDVF